MSAGALARASESRRRKTGTQTMLNTSPMPNPTRRMIALAALAVAIVAAVVALDLSSATAQSEEQRYGKITARRVADDRIEFGWQPTTASGAPIGPRVFPRARYFPPDARVDRWLNSSPVEVDGAEIGRINARLRSDGRIEFAFTPTDGERIAPSARYFPVDARVGRWLRSTEITISAAPAAGFVAVSAGGWHNCAIRAGSGAIECWGHHDVGQTNAPAGRFTAVSAGSDHTCAIRESGAIACWGSNSGWEWDEAGTAAVVHVGQATPPAGRFTAVSAGRYHTCAIRAESGAIECWGRNDSGQTDAPEGSYTALAVGGSQTCAIRAGSGAIECWGYKDGWYTDAPAGSFTTISAAWGHACAIRESGAIACWGNSGIWSYVDDAGRVRDHETGLFDAPAGSFTAISSAVAYACAIRAGSGAIACWGLNGYPTNETGEWQTSETGQTDAPAGSFIAVSTGQTHSCGLRDTGAIECWGGKGSWLGQTDAPTP